MRVSDIVVVAVVVRATGAAAARADTFAGLRDVDARAVVDVPALLVIFWVDGFWLVVVRAGVVRDDKVVVRDG